MNELFRFVGVKKIGYQPDHNKQIDLKGLTGKYYDQARAAKSQKDLETVRQSFIKSALINDPYLIDPPLTAFYRKMKGRTSYTLQQIESYCRDITNRDIASFVGSSHFKSAKNIIGEQLFFLMLKGEKRYSSLKIVYKHLLKIIGLCEAIAHKNPDIDSILNNPGLQIILFDIPVHNQPSSTRADSGGKLPDKNWKEEFKAEFDYILSLKSSQDKLMKLHKTMKANLQSGLRKSLSTKISTVKLTGTDATKKIQPTEVLDFKMPSRSFFLATAKDLDDGTKKNLAQLGLDELEFEPLMVINTLEEEILRRSNKLNSRLSRHKYTSYQGRKVFNSRGFNFNSLNFTTDGRREFFFAIDNLDVNLPANEPVAPLSFGKAKVLGEGKLYRVEEDYLGCRLGNLSAVVNIPPYSKKEFSDRHFSKSVVTTESETSNSSIEETSAESKEQNSMSAETEKTVAFDMSLQAGVNVSASYGPTIGVEASSNFETGLSVSETSKSSTSYAKDVTLRSVKKIEQRVRQLIKAERTYENETINKESFDNQNATPGAGIYQWINEVYKAKLVQYDSRLLLEFMVPQPGHLLLYAAGNPFFTPGNEAPVEPDPFTIVIDDIKPETYKELASQLGATDVLPPPSPTTTLTKAFSFLDTIENDKLTNFTFKDDSITIPDGYNADFVRALIVASRPQHNSANAVTVTICHDGYTFNDPRREDAPGTRERREQFEFDVLSNYRNIPIAVTGYQDRSFTLSVVVYCIANSYALDKWKFETYGKLKQAHQRLMDDYNDKLRQFKQRSFVGGGSLGNNPDKNRNMEKEELKRSCLSILTHQFFNLFNSMNDEDGVMPTINFEQAEPEGNYVRFFENAFEWIQLTYILYPYFWSDPGKNWLRSLSLALDDPKHEEFLKSGFARVVVPVRPEFNGAILKYLENGEIWDGENPDDIDLTHPLYLQIVTEIMERQGKLQESPETEDEWEYELPTNLQIISNGTSIPKPPFL